MLGDGRIRRLWGVLVPRELFFDSYTRAAAASLVAGSEAALTGLTAAWLHGCPAAEFGTVHIAVPYARCLASTEGLVVHQGRRLLEDIVEIRGLRSVTLEVAVTELLCTDTPRRALAVADQAAALLPERERAAFQLRLATRLGSRADRRGTARANGLLPLVTGKAESPPESWLKLLVVEAGFPLPVDQFPVVDILGCIRYVLDLCWPQLRIALEYDGYESHEFRGDADALRDRDLRCRGWITVRATAEDLREPAALLDRLEDAFRIRGVVGFRRGFEERLPRHRGGAGTRRVERFVAPDALLG